MSGFQILFAVEGYKEDKIRACKDVLTSYGIQIDNIYSVQSINQLKDFIFEYPDINAIVVSEQLDGYTVSINDLIMFNKTNNKIIVPVISRNKKGNFELMDYIKNNFYNILFESDTLINELGNIFFWSRTVEAAMSYAGLNKAYQEEKDNPLGKNNPLEKNNSLEKEVVKLQFELPDCNRGKQTVFNDKSVAIGFCGSDKEFECTVSAISAANYIAMGGYKVALIEPDFSRGAVLSKLLPCISEKDVITCAGVDYYGDWNMDKDVYSADVMIFDLGSMNFEEAAYLSKMKKIFICSDIVNIAQSGKLQNNGSFKYSILYKDKQGMEHESLEVFKDCSPELKRLLQITLLSHGLDITHNTEINNVSRIKQLNALNKSEGYQEDVKIDREPKRSKDSNKRSLSPGKNPLPNHVPEQPVRSVKSEAASDTREKKLKAAEQLQKAPANKTEPVQTMTGNPKESKYRPEEPAAAANTYMKQQGQSSFTDEKYNASGWDNIKYDEARVQEDEYYHYKTNDTRMNDVRTNAERISDVNINDASKSPYSLKDDNNREAGMSAKGFFTGGTIGNMTKSYLQQKNENKQSKSPQWLSKDVGMDFSSNNMRNYDEYGSGNDYSGNDYSRSEDESVSGTEYTDTYEDDNQKPSMFDYLEDSKNKLKKKQPANQVLCGKETIFITGLKHGCGCSHTGLSFAKYISGAYSENICVCHKKGTYDLEDEEIAEYTKDYDYGSVFSNNRFIIYDCGILGDLNEEQLSELKRSNIKIMVCNGDEKYLGNLSKFIRSLGNLSAEWIFAFNLVTSRDKELMIRKIMEGYKICFIPLHDRDNPSRKVSKIWDSVLKRNLL